MMKTLKLLHYLMLLTILSIIIPSQDMLAQHQVSISQTGTGANSCSRTLSANVQGGSGNYSYMWSVVTPGISFPGPNNLQTVNVALNQTADLMVVVTDNTTSTTAQDVITVHRVLLGSFDIFIPNFITPNGDGYNDAWVVRDADKGYTSINAYSYAVTITNSNNTQLYTNTATVSSNYIGLLGGDILWNAMYNGSVVSTGIYSYSLTLQNCSQSTNYTGSITVVY